MKKTLFKTLTACAVLMSGSSAFAGRIDKNVYTDQAIVDAWTQAQVQQALEDGARFAPGIYLSAGGTAYIYVAGDSIYAGNTAGNQSSLVVTEEKLTRASVSAITDIITARLDNRTGRNGGSASASHTAFNASTGQNGGSTETPFALWSRLDFTRFNDTTAGAKWNANLWTLALGADYQLNERVLAGMAFTYGYVTGKTNFNNGKIKGDHAFGVNPYLNVMATNWLDFDAIAGYARVNKKRSRNPMNDTISAGTVTAKTHSNRYFASLAANAHKTINKVALLGRLGYSYGQDEQKKYTESNGDMYTSQDTKINRLFVRLQTGFLVSEMFTPYLFVTYDHDFSITKHGLADVISDDTTGYVKPKQNTSNWYGGGAGVIFASGRNWSGDVGYGFKATKNIRMHNGNIRLRYQF